MILRIAQVAGVSAILCLCIVHPFLPGSYDALALSLSTFVQACGVISLPLAAVGILWSIREANAGRKLKRNPPQTHRRHDFTMFALVAASVVATACVIAGFAIAGVSLGVLSAVIWFCIVARLLRERKLAKSPRPQTRSAVPLYLTIVPIVVSVFQLAVAVPATELSRNRAIANSKELIHDIELYCDVNGQYPASLSAVWKDYYASVVGVEKFSYTRNGDSYDLFFEQPRFLFDGFGTREFVVYNRLDSQVMTRHTSWILILSPEELKAARGWYAVSDLGTPHWKYFRFN